MSPGVSMPLERSCGAESHRGVVPHHSCSSSNKSSSTYLLLIARILTTFFHETTCMYVSMLPLIFYPLNIDKRHLYHAMYLTVSPPRRTVALRDQIASFLRTVLRED